MQNIQSPIHSDNDNVENFFDSAEDFSSSKTQDITPFEGNLSEEIDANISDSKVSEDNLEDENSDFFANSNDNFDSKSKKEFSDSLESEILKNQKIPADSEQKNNPFEEIFNPDAVVNRAKTANMIVAELDKNENDFEKIESFYIAKNELENLFSDNPGIKIFKRDDSGNLIEHKPENSDDSYNSNQTFVTNLLGLQDNDLIEISVPVKNHQKESQNSTVTYSKHENDDENYSDNDDEENYYLPDDEETEKRRKNDLQATFQGIKQVIEDLIKTTEYQEPDELFREFLQTNFKDYLLAKKITGNSKVKSSDKVISKDAIENTDKQVEISDLMQNVGSAVKKTSILVNRNSDMEIEDIEILCKCGEKTVIKFDATDNLERDNLEFSDSNAISTNIVIDTIKPKPLNANSEEVTTQTPEITANPEETIIEQDSEMDEF